MDSYSLIVDILKEMHSHGCISFYMEKLEKCYEVSSV